MKSHNRVQSTNSRTNFYFYYILRKTKNRTSIIVYIFRWHNTNYSHCIKANFCLS